MKSLATLSMLFIIGSLYAPLLEAQSAGDYQSKASTAWQLASTWEKYDGAGWIPAATPPTNLDGIITIKAGHTVICSTAVTVDQLQILGSLTITSAGILNLADGAGEDLVVANYAWLQNGQINGPGTITVNAGSTLQLSAGGTFGAGTISTQLTNNGTLSWLNSTGGGPGVSILTLTGGTIINNGAFNIQNTGGPMSHRINGGNIINNNSITYTATGTSVKAEFLVNKFTNNSGAVIQGNAIGQMILQAAVGDTHEGQFISNSSAGMVFKGLASQIFGAGSVLTGTGPMEFNQGSHELNGTYTPASTRITGGATQFNHASLDFNYLYLSAGTFGGPVLKNMTGNMGWDGGTISGGSITIPATKTLAIGGGAYITWTLATNLTNNGTIGLANANGGCCGSSTLVMTGQTLTNNGTFNFSYSGYEDGTTQKLSGGSFINNGSVTTTSSLNEVELNVNYLYNSSTGIIFAQMNKSLLLNITIGATHDGVFKSNSTVEMKFSGAANQIFSSTSEFQGTGDFNFAGGSHTILGNYISTGNTHIESGAIVNFNMASITFPGAFHVNGGNFSGSANRTMNGNLYLATGTLSGSGTITIPVGKTMGLYNAGGTHAIAANLVNNGSMDWASFSGGSGISILNINGGTVTNNGSINCTRSTNMKQRMQNGSFINHGTFTRASGGTEFLIEATANLTSDGTITLNHVSGEPTKILGTKNIGGTLNMATGVLETNVFNFSGPTLNLSGQIVSSAGRFNFTGSSLQTYSGTGTGNIQYIGMNGAGGLQINAFLGCGDLLITNGHIYIQNA
jgi:hypothetical protein